MKYEKHAGLTAGAAGTLIVKLVPEVRALIVGSAIVVLHVIPSLVPKPESKTGIIWLFSETAVVETTTVVAPASITTEPAGAAPHAAAPALSAQLVLLAKVAPFKIVPAVIGPPAEIL